MTHTSNNQIIKYGNLDYTYEINTQKQIKTHGFGIWQHKHIWIIYSPKLMEPYHITKVDAVEDVLKNSQ